MPPLNRDIQRSMEEVERITAPDGATAETFRLHGIDYPCSASSYDRRVEIDAQGNPVEVDITLLVRKEVLLGSDSPLEAEDPDLTDDSQAVLPKSGDNIVFRSLNLKIVNVRVGGTQSHYELLCRDQASA